jgi:hypothetical protein
MASEQTTKEAKNTPKTSKRKESKNGMLSFFCN